MRKRTDEELMTASVKIIERGGAILLRKKSVNKSDKSNYRYIHQHTEIAAGPDHAVWVYRSYRRTAKEFFSLKFALTIAPLYDCTVVVIYPKKK